MTNSPDFEISPHDLAQINEDQQTVENVATLQRRGGVEWLLKVLKTHSENGISSSELETRRVLFGSNKLDDIPPESWLSIFFGSFNDATLIVLIVSALVSLVIGIYEDPKKGWVEGAAILTAVFAVAIVTATNDYSKDQQFRALNKVKEDISVTVRRNGKVDQVSIYDVVVGDVIEVNSGDKVPCDGVLIEAYEVSANESSLTGESDDVNKGPEDMFLLSGCQLTGGSGKIVAIAVGKESRWGRIRDKLEQETRETPLQEKLDDMANFIGYVGMAAAAATFVAIVGMWWWNKDEKSVPLFDTVLKAFIMAVTIVVVAVPEGLPLAVTISLAYSTKKMLRDKNLIRHLAACETMGNATTICSDKTGTLTENRMTVTQCWLPGQSQMSSPPPQLQSGPVRDLLTEGIALNTTANLLKTFAPNGGVNKGDKKRSSITTVLGNKTEGALLMLIDKWGTDYEAVRASKKGQYRIHPFSSQRKMMSVLVRKSPTSQQHTLYVKGAAEIIVVQCTKELRADGTVAAMTVEGRKQLQDLITDMAKQSLRAVSLAHRSVEGDVEDLEALEKDLTLDAIVGITDSLRPDVVEAVRTCQRAGIMVRMVTGDNVETAKAIARQCGILKKTGTVLEGPGFRNLTPAQLDKVLPTLQVLARSSPDDKHTLVARLNGSLPEKRVEWEKQHPGKSWDRERDNLLPGYMGEWTTSRRHGLGEVVGVTGDGTNDAPALRVADVGLSMGISGTEVAKEASDIVILDDNFASIVKAVLWGRSVFDNIRKFLQFQLTVNVVALTLTFLSAVSGYDPPLNAVMMLWVNLIMDTMGALALGTEAPDPRLLTRQPYKRNASLISRPMWRNILVQSAFQIAVLVLLLLRADEVLRMVSSAAFMLPPMGDAIALVEHGSVRHMTIIFNAFVFCQIFNEFNARSIGDDANILRGLRKNPMFMAIIAFTIIVQFLIIQFGGDFTKTEPLTYAEWKVTVIIGLCALPLGNAMRLIPIHENPANFAGTAVMEEENIEPEERPHVKHRTRLYKIFVRTLRVLVLLILPVLFAMCYKKPEACRGIHFLEYWKF